MPKAFVGTLPGRDGSLNGALEKVKSDLLSGFSEEDKMLEGGCFGWREWESIMCLEASRWLGMARDQG